MKNLSLIEYKRSIPENILEKFIDSINGIYHFNGYKNFDDEDVENILDEVLRFVSIHHEDILINQIFSIIESGKRGDYGEYSIVSPKLVLGWLNAWWRENHKEISRKKMLSQKKLPQHIPSNLEILNSYYLDFLKDNNTIWNIGYRIYDLLSKGGIEMHTEEEFSQQLEKSKTEVLAEKRTKIDKSDMLHIRAILKESKILKETKDLSQNTEISNHAKSFFARRKFEEIKEQGHIGFKF